MQARYLLLIIIFCSTFVHSQNYVDSIGNEKKILSKEKKDPGKKLNQVFIFNPSLKKESDTPQLPLNLKVYSKAISNDYSQPLKLTEEELGSGLSDEDIAAFRNNRDQFKKELAEFYGEDLINIQKLLESLGITKEQVVAFVAALKFLFGQSLIPAPR